MTREFERLSKVVTIKAGRSHGRIKIVAGARYARVYFGERRRPESLCPEDLGKFIVNGVPVTGSMSFAVHGDAWGPTRSYPERGDRCSIHHALWARRDDDPIDDAVSSKARDFFFSDAFLGPILAVLTDGESPALVAGRARMAEADAAYKSALSERDDAYRAVDLAVEKCGLASDLLDDAKNAFVAAGGEL